MVERSIPQTIYHGMMQAEWNWQIKEAPSTVVPEL